jgi:hypothetical protein
MSTTIEANVSKMFADFEPWDVSNSVANLGSRAGELTWANAMRIARDVTEWMAEPLIEGAAEAMREWAERTGAWDRDDVEGWTETEALALFVQNVASELRELGSDDHTLSECAERCAKACGDAEYGCVVGYYHYTDPTNVLVSYYTGC